MKLKAVIGAFILSLLTCVACLANDHADIMHTLRSQLADKAAARDSLLLMQNIYDLTMELEPAKADSIAESIYQLAVRSKNNAAALDMIRQRANNHHSDDSVLLIMQKRALALPESADRDRTLTFISVTRCSNRVRNITDDERREHFTEQIKQYITAPPTNAYDKIVLLYSICANLARETHGELLINYIDRLGELIDSVPDPDYVLRNVYNVQSAMALSMTGDAEKALAADRRLLANIDSLEARYARAGRPYRYFDSNRYIIYTRMLSNWQNLSAKETERLYTRAMKIRDRDIRAKKTYEISPRPSIYYAMAKKDYPTAYQLLISCIDHPKNQRYRRSFLKYLSESAAATGHEKVALDASREYAQLLEESIETRTQERYKELQILYNMHEVREEYDAMVAERQAAVAQIQKRMIIIGFCFLVLLVILLIVVVRLYRKKRGMAENLSRANNALRLESSNLRESQAELTKARDRAQQASNFKSDFIKNISREISVPLRAIAEYSHLIVDCTEATNKPYLERYADLIDQNCALIDSIASDVLHMAEIDSDTLDITPQTVDLYKTVAAVVDSVKPHEGVSVALDENSPHIDVTTDPRRLQQILIALISNGIKFTPQGSVLVSYRPIHQGQGVEISVADTGIGIPPKEAENIFGRFVKLDRETAGVGLGLAIARMLARMLRGDVRLDTSYSGGARFIVTIPVIYRKK